MGMSKQAEKDLIMAAVKELREKAGSDSYIADLFGSDLVASMFQAIDCDFCFGSFSEIQAEKAKRSEELDNLNADIQKRAEFARGLEDRIMRNAAELRALEEKLNAIAESVSFTRAQVRNALKPVCVK